MRPRVLARSLTTALLTTTALSPLALHPAEAQSLPTGYATAYGRVGFQRAGGTLHINQSSQDAIVNYNSFSIGARKTVTIHQPNRSSALLNRVTGNTPSTIAGYLRANGQVYLVNPNGIVITKSGVVKVGGGFTASSLGMTDEEFKHARKQFQGSGASPAVTNAGTIIIGRGGYAALIGGEVKNSGSILVPMGRVGLGAGEMATLDVSGDGFLQVALPSTASRRGALVSNTGTISAAGGLVVLNAATARAAARNAINISGAIDAHSISGHSGAIVIGGGDGGTVRVSGPLSVASRSSKGGTVTITGQTIALRHAHIDASGASGGGTVKIGGDLHGGGMLPHAGTVTIDATSVIRADATKTGNGGSVVVWSDAATHFAGLVTAKGGMQGGDGGDAEVSSHGLLDYTGATDLTAAKGAMGTLLLDPYNVTISTGTGSGTTQASGGFAANANDSIINAGTLLTALGTANVTVSTGSAGSQAGTITLAANTPLSWNTGATLTLQAAGNIILNSAITTPAGGLTLSSGGTIMPTAAVSVARFTLAAGDWVQNGASLPGFAAGDFQVIGGSFLRAAGGNGTNGSPYLLTDIYGMQGMGTSSTYLAANYRLSNDIDASATATWNGGAGFIPVGRNASPFTGGLNGAGHTVTGLTILQTSDQVGLIGRLGSGGRVSNIGLIGGSVSGPAVYFTGALVGLNEGTVSQAYSTASVSGFSAVGGLVGGNGGTATVSQSYATGAITGFNGYDVGGLVGYNAGTVTQSHATGGLSGGNFGQVGGLVGLNDGGTVSQSYATGAVLPLYGDNVGGLVGQNNGTVRQSYATGAVSIPGPGSAGGLVGQNGGAIIQSYATGAVSSPGYAGGLVGYNDGTVSQSYASGPVSGSNVVGGLAGSNLNGSIDTSYWDIQTTGQANGVSIGFGSGAGVTGLTTAQARSTSSYTGFDFTNVWYQAGDMRPILRSEAAPAVNGIIPISNLNQLQLMGANLSGSYALTTNIDASATNSVANSAGIWGAGGFVPVGDGTSAFTGSLSGAGHTITGLTIVHSGDDVGLIGNLAGGSVGSISLVGGSVSGNGYYLGALVGLNNGTVIQASSSASVSGSNAVGGLVGGNGSNATVSQSFATGSVLGTNADVGGLLGYNAGTVSLSFASGAVSGGYTSSYVGGLVGFNQGVVSQSYATGDVSAGDRHSLGSNATAGGLVGSNYDTVSQSYATGSVSGSGSVGGLAGDNYGTVSQSYATGRVTGGLTFGAGGLVGFNANSINTSYWDTQTTGQSRSFSINNGSVTGVAGLTTAQARDASNYAGFDFSTVWYQAGDMRPILRSEAAPAVNGIISVSNLHQLQLMGANLSGSYQLTTDIDASPTNSTASSSGIWGAGGFVPVGDGATPFTGSLNGAGHTITGLTIALPSQNYVGLIGDLSSGGGSVSGIGLVGGSVSGSRYVGALVGANSGSIIQAYANTSVDGAAGVGGLAGQNYGTVSQSDATGGASGSGNVGGLVGENYGTVFQSYATGSANSTDSGTVGGLVGLNYGTVSESYAVGSVGAGRAGTVGGLVGENYGTVSQTYAMGGVSAGISSNVGGLVGRNHNTVNESYATGSVRAGSYSSVGGLVGYDSGTIGTSHWNTQTTGQAYGIGRGSSAGATGLTTAQMQDLANFATTYAGFDFTNIWAPPNQAGQGGQSTASYPQLYSLSNVVAVTPNTSRTYGAANPGLIAGYTGLQAGDFVTSLGTLTTNATTASNVGTYAATASGTSVTSAAGNTYRIVYVPGALNVTPAAVTMTALGGTSTYGTAPTNPGLSATGLQNGESVSTLTGLSNSFGIGATTNVGTYAISVSGTLSNANYTIAGIVDGAWTVSPAALTISAANQSKTYSQTASLGNTAFTTTGLVNSDTVTSVTLTSAGAPAGAPVAGSPYAITVSGAQGTGLSNYTIAYVAGQLAVTPALATNATMSPIAPPVLPASTLGSSADRAAEELAAIADGRAGALATVLVRLDDPRFDVSLDCIKGVCTIVTARKTDRRAER